MLARFRDHTIKLFDRHGMKTVAFWTPIDEPQKSTTLVYILQHPSRNEAAANWKSFQDDPESNVCGTRQPGLGGKEPTRLSISAPDKECFTRQLS